MMDFYEELRKRAMEKVEQLHIPASLDSLQAVQATIEALKEMMVGEIIRGELLAVHRKRYPTDTLVSVRCNTMYGDLGWEGVHGTDGEEVVVIVFRLRKP